MANKQTAEEKIAAAKARREAKEAAKQSVQQVQDETTDTASGPDHGGTDPAEEAAQNEAIDKVLTAKAPKLTKTGLPKLPAIKRTRKPKPAKDCACGCGAQTKGGRFVAGHDARLHGWALRVSRALLTIEQVAEMAGQGTADAVSAHLAAAAKQTA